MQSHGPYTCPLGGIENNAVTLEHGTKLIWQNIAIAAPGFGGVHDLLHHCLHLALGEHALVLVFVLD